MNACTKWHAGYGLIAMRVVSHSVPRPRTRRARSGSSPAKKASNKPCGPSKIVEGPVNPRRARSAATIPPCAAQPACKRFVSEPSDRYANKPDDCEPAIPNACAISSDVSPHKRPATAAAPNVPHKPVVCWPRTWNRPGAAAPMRVATS